jgi:hypothetical protein
VTDSYPALLGRRAGCGALGASSSAGEDVAEIVIVREHGYSLREIAHELMSQRLDC